MKKPRETTAPTPDQLPPSIPATGGAFIRMPDGSLVREPTPVKSGQTAVKDNSNAD